MRRLSLIILMLWGLLGCASPVNRGQIVDQETNVATVMQRGDAAYKRQDYATALHEWQFLAQHGNPVAQYRLGGMYAQGLGVARDLAEAQRLFAKAAENLPPGRDRDMAVQARAQVERILATHQATSSLPASATPHTPISASPSSPPVTAAVTPLAPIVVSQSPSLIEEISLVKVGGVYALPVEINGVLTLKFVLDSGAAEVNIPADVVLTLVRTGTIKGTDFLPGKTYVLANGSELKSPRFIIRSLRIGSRHVQDVPASVGTLTSSLLLGQSLLEKLGTWGIDTQRQVLVVGALPSAGKGKQTPGDSLATPYAKTVNGKEPRAIIDTKFGSMEIRFFPEKAPKHVENFIQLAKAGFYDKTIFHRVIPAFMIRGGDPNTKDEQNKSSYGKGGPGYSVKAEFNDRPHVRGAVSMARAQDPDSAGSQFFILVKDAPHLHSKYTVFGEVVKGIEVVDKIVAQPRDTHDNPLERIEMTVRIVE
jgi:peptidyl-prolyl cis-trans isomerase B (cyclophilin B)